MDAISNSLDIDVRKRIITFIDSNLVPHFPHQMRYEYYILNNNFSAAGKLAVDYVIGVNVLHNSLPFLFKNTAKNSDDRINQFNDYIQTFSAEQINKLTVEIPKSDLDIKFVEAVLNKFKYPVWGNQEGLPVEYYIQSYIYSGILHIYLVYLTMKLANGLNEANQKNVGLSCSQY